MEYPSTTEPSSAYASSPSYPLLSQHIDGAVRVKVGSAYCAATNPTFRNIPLHTKSFLLPSPLQSCFNSPSGSPYGAEQPTSVAPTRRLLELEVTTGTIIVRLGQSNPD
jgi:hypothetical protein